MTDFTEELKNLPPKVNEKNELEEGLLRSAMKEDISSHATNEDTSSLINDHFSPPSDGSSPHLSDSNIEKDYDFGSASSRRESDGESWETVSEELREEADALEEEQQDFPDEFMMKSMSYSHRLMTRITHSDEELPENVSQIVTDDGAYIYVVGTAHFSKASQDDVEKVIKLLHPDVVMVELCSSRVGVLKYDEESLLKAAKEVNITKLKYAIKETGSVVSGLMQMLLLSMSAHITKQLGMAPGGEFRVACRESRQIPGCKLVLGDRPIQATIGRAMASLSIFQKLQLGWHLLFSKDSITKEDVERYKQKDMIAEMLTEMTGDFPELSRVFVEERDQYMAQMLMHYVENVRSDLPEYIPIQRTTPFGDTVNSNELDDEEDNDVAVEHIHKSDYKPIIVGVVGIGHMNGIINNIGRNFCLHELCIIPPASFASKSFSLLFKASLVAVFSWSAYSIIRWLKLLK